MAQTIISGFDDVWVSSADFNTVKGEANPTEYRVRQFVIKRVADSKLFFGYQVESLKANTDSIYVGRVSLDSLSGIIQAKNSTGGTVGSAYGYDRGLSKWNKVSGKYAIMVYALDSYPDVNSVRYYGEFSGTKLYVGIYYDNNGSNLRGDFEITETVISSYLNVPPTVSVTSPADNLTLVEGNTYPIAGTATDADSGNVVTVKYKFDNGTAYNLTASVSDGTTPINFSKTLTYLNNRLYDGQNPVTPILDENVTHTLTVWAEDDQGGKSPDTTRNFTVLYNQPPEISGSDQDLGTITAPPSIQYSVTDVEGYSFTITEAVDGNTIRTFPGVDGQQETLTIPLEMWITLEPGVTHQLTITATDQYNATSVRTYTFIRAVEGIELETTEILPADAQPSRVILSLNGTIPANANLNVQVCNNAHDPSPTWEDMTDSVKNGRPYVFTNTTSTTGQWGIRFKISILPGA